MTKLRKLFFALGSLVVLSIAATVSHADTITFATTGFLQYTANNQTVFTSLALGPVTFGTNENNVTIGFTRLFPFQTFTIDPNNPVSTNFGVLNITVNGSGATIPADTTFFLDISRNDVQPGEGTPGFGDLVAQLTGTFETGGPGGVLTFTVPNITLGRFIFSTSPVVIPLAVGDTPLQGQVTETVPEPASILLLTIGLGGIALRVRKKPL
jgi:hypothetical protein